LRLSPRLEIELGGLAGVGYTLLMYAVNYWIILLIPGAADYGGPIVLFDLFIMPILIAWAVYRKRKLFAFSVAMIIASLLTVELLFGTYYLVTSLMILVGI